MYVSPEYDARGLGGSSERVQLVRSRLPHTRLEGIADACVRVCIYIIHMYEAMHYCTQCAVVCGPSFITSTPIQRPSSPTAVACSLRSLRVKGNIRYSFIHTYTYKPKKILHRWENSYRREVKLCLYIAHRPTCSARLCCLCQRSLRADEE